MLESHREAVKKNPVGVGALLGLFGTHTDHSSKGVLGLFSSFPVEAAGQESL